MKIDVCDVCLTKNKLTKTTAKGQTAFHGNRMSLCKSKTCHATWKKINTNKPKLLELFDQAEKNSRELLK